MKKQLVASLVGGVILFIWQFLSWSVLPVHQSVYGYTANQDQILEALSQNLTEEGTYMIPGVPPGTSHEQAAESMKDKMDKPWASISYHKSFDTNMGMNMFRGFVIDLLSAFFLTWILLQFQNLNMRTALQASLFVGFIGFMTIPYLNSIWFKDNSMGHLVDAVVAWGLVGLWLGWWLPRQSS